MAWIGMPACAMCQYGTELVPYWPVIGRDMGTGSENLNYIYLRS